MKNLLMKELEDRPDLLIIFSLITKKSKVLDLGCGKGILLDHLRFQKECRVCGIEVSQKKILECVERGVPVIHDDLDNGLNDYPENSFDCVVLSQTLQAVRRPDALLKDMMRVGHKAYVSLINIGHIRARLQLALKGIMPLTPSLPYQWFETKNIHLSTIRDFRKLCEQLDFTIEKTIPLGYRSHFLARLWPNIFAPTCVFVISRKTMNFEKTK
jgi:methionine biosynthesis protein MetW